MPTNGENVEFLNAYSKHVSYFSLYFSSFIDRVNEKFKTLKRRTYYVNISCCRLKFNLLKPTGYVMHQQFNIQQLYVLPTLCLCVLYLSENKQRLVSVTS